MFVSPTHQRISGVSSPLFSRYSELENQGIILGFLEIKFINSSEEENFTGTFRNHLPTILQLYLRNTYFLPIDL